MPEEAKRSAQGKKKKRRDCMYLNAVIAPFLGRRLAGLTGRWLGTRGRGFVTVLCMGTCTVLSFLVFYEIRVGSSAIVLSLGSWFGTHTLGVDWL